MTLAFKKHCDRCDNVENFVEEDLKDYCSNLHLFGFSFFGGIKFYTIREILISLSIRKQALIGKCIECGAIKVECPHCKTLLNIEEAKLENCKICEESFYVCI